MVPGTLYYGMERAFTSEYHVRALVPCYSEWDLRTSGLCISQELLRNAESQLPYLQNEDGVSFFYPRKSKEEIKYLRAFKFLGREDNN